jgi:succinoglycan biosynthesis transport protein ExoP
MASQGSSNPPDVGVSGARASGFSVTSSDTSLSEVLITLRKRRWILIVCVLLGIFYGIYRGTSQPKLYVATGQIQVRTGSSNEYRVTAVSPLMGGDSATRMTTEVNILRSESLLLTVARDLNLANDPNFFGGKPGVPTHYSLDDPSIRQAAVSTLQNNLTVTLLTRTDIIRISYSSLDAKLSADIVNKVISEYIQRSYETRFTSTQRVTQWLSGQLDDLKQQVETSESQMIDVQKRLGIIGLDPTHSSITTSVEDLSRATDQARIARILAESRYRTLSGMGTDAVDPASTYGGGAAPLPAAPSIPSGSSAPSGSSTSSAGLTGTSTPSSSVAPAGNSTVDAATATISGQVQGLRGQLSSMQAQYAQTQATLGPNHPTVKALKAQIDELTKQVALEQDRMLQASKEAYLIAQSSEKQTSSTLGSERDNAYKLRDDLVEYNLRQREYESNRVLYDSLRQRLRAAGVQAGLESLEIDVVDQALPPPHPTLQSKSTILIVAVAFALMVGVALAFLLESLDTGLRSIAEIEAITELPSLAIIPRSRRSSTEPSGNLSAAARNISVLTQPKSQFAEAIRSLRTSLLLSTTGHPPKFILFTSATPSEGKTTIASNLACVLAQRDTSVLLIDADLRRPNVHHRFGLNGKVGVTTLLTGSTTLENTVQRVPEVPNLHILPSGPVPPFPTEMLTSQAMDDLLEQCGKLYTHIVIDSPPILSVTDGVLLARKADAVALVIRHGKSSKHVVRRARDLLMRAGAPIAGIVLNAVDLNAPEYYGYYGYSGYSYSSIDADSWESKAASSGDKKSGRS